MRKMTVLLLLAISVFGTTSFALSHPSGWACPLKNLKKSQLRGADGTAYIPKTGVMNHQISAQKGSARN